MDIYYYIYEEQNFIRKDICQLAIFTLLLNAPPELDRKANNRQSMPALPKPLLLLQQQGLHPQELLLHPHPSQLQLLQPHPQGLHPHERLLKLSKATNSNRLVQLLFIYYLLIVKKPYQSTICVKNFARYRYIINSINIFDNLHF